MYSPRYLNTEGTLIHLTVSDDETMVIDAKHSPAEFNKAVAGAYGSVQTYVAAEGEGPVVKEVSCTRLQAKAALLEMGLLGQVTALVAQMDELTQLAWAEASTFKRSSPLINALTDYIVWPDGSSLTALDVDELFAIAKTIEV